MIMPPGYIRRKHLKTRDGCIQCKRRRIKCDENGTVTCRPCAKGRHICSFAPPPPSVTSTFSATTLLDLELLHNFSTQTGKSLSDNVDLQNFFSTNFVQLAFGYDYLLHSILALSAFHIAHESESNRHDDSQDSAELTDKYLLAAYHHHDIALNGYRHCLSDVNSQTCHPIFGCACILFITALARPRETGSSQLMPSTPKSALLDVQLSEWMIHIRGIPSILGHNESLSSLRQGPLAPLMKSRDSLSTKGGDRDTMDGDAASYLSTLSEAIYQHSDPTTVEICQSSIEKLHEAVGELNKPHDMVLAFTWPLRVGPDYFHLLELQNSEALLVFAYYCVFLNSISTRWWIKDWPRFILKSVEPLIDKTWMPWLKWPLEKVFRQREAL